MKATEQYFPAELVVFIFGKNKIKVLSSTSGMQGLKIIYFVEENRALF